VEHINKLADRLQWASSSWGHFVWAPRGPLASGRAARRASENAASTVHWPQTGPLFVSGLVSACLLVALWAARRRN